MIGDGELQELVQFESGNKVLSLYLDTNLAHRSKDAVKLLFKEHIRNLEDHPPKDDIERIEKFLDFEYDWQARGLAIFSSGKDLWKVIPLPISVRTQAFFTEKPYVHILSDVLDRFGRYNVVLLDRESVRLFSVAWGRIQSETQALGEALKRHKQGGRAAARYQRHEDNHALHNLKQAVEFTQAFCDQTKCDRIMLGGTSEILAQVKELMPSQMQAKIIGEFVADMGASPSGILE